MTLSVWDFPHVPVVLGALYEEIDGDRRGNLIGVTTEATTLGVKRRRGYYHLELREKAKVYHRIPYENVRLVTA